MIIHHKIPNNRLFPTILFYIEIFHPRIAFDRKLKDCMKIDHSFNRVNNFLEMIWSLSSINSIPKKNMFVSISCFGSNLLLLLLLVNIWNLVNWALTLSSNWKILCSCFALLVFCSLSLCFLWELTALKWFLCHVTLQWICEIIAFCCCFSPTLNENNCFVLILKREMEKTPQI